MEPPTDVTHVRPLERIWPPARIRVRTPRMELRVPDDAELAALAALAGEGIHDPDRMPFSNPWTDAAPEERTRGLVQWHWSARAGWTHGRSWNLLLAAVVDGEVAGCQDVAAERFDVRREVITGSWLGARFQRRGLGTEMRQAVLALAFDGLGARAAHSSAYADNPASLRVSEKCGYAWNGDEAFCRARGEHAPGGASEELIEHVGFRITRDGWEPRRRSDIEVSGIDDEVRAAFGA